MPRWRKEEDDAVAAIGAAREQPGAVYAAWPSLELPDRTLTGQQVKKRWHDIKSKYASNVPSAPASPPEPAKHRKRATPMDERAEAAGVKYENTPDGLREIIANGSPAAAAKARHEIKRHKTTMSKKAGRAEAARAGKVGGGEEQFQEAWIPHFKGNCRLNRMPCTVG